MITYMLSKSLPPHSMVRAKTCELSFALNEIPVHAQAAVMEIAHNKSKRNAFFFIAAFIFDFVSFANVVK